MAIMLIVAIGLGLAAWSLSDRVFSVKAELEAAQSLTTTLQAQVTALDIPGAEGTLAEIRSHTSRGVALTDDPLWAFGEDLPVLGKNLSAVREIGQVTDDAMANIAVPLLNVAGSLDPSSLAPKDGAINIQPLIDAIPAVREADVGVQDSIRAVSSVDTEGAVGQVVAAKNKLGDLLRKLAPITATLNTVLPLLPPALGSEAPRKYVVMFQNNAELRALGGTALSFAVINVTGGRIEFAETIPAGFKNFTASDPVIESPDGTIDLYRGTLGSFIANATSRPSFTTAAQITQEMWIRDQGYPVDGIVSIDPVALSYVLRATGPIPLSTGDVLTSDSLVPLLLNGLYQRFNSRNYTKDNLAQDVVYGEAVDATFSRLMAGPIDPPTLVAALTQGWNESRILFWSAHEDEEAQLRAAGPNGELPVSDEKTERLGLYFEDNVGSKLGFYLQQSVQLSQASCRADGRENYRVATSLVNGVDPSGVKSLSASITGAFARERLAPAVYRLAVLLYAPPGSQIVGASVDGVPVAVDPHHDTDYPVGRIVVTMKPGATANVTYDVVAASAGSKTLEAQITPTVNPTTLTTVPLDCATVPAG
jgi:hypothetical protein